jgi:hypothetical protein
MKKSILAVWFPVFLCALAAAGAPAGKDADSSEDLALLRRTSKAFSSVAQKTMPAIVFI